MNAVTVKNLTKVFRQGDEDIYAVDQIADPGFEGFCHCIYMRKSPAFAGLFRRAAAGQIKAVPPLVF